MKYQVQENGKPCDHFNHNVDDSWDCSTYDTFEEAVVYLNKWLDTYGPVPSDFKLGSKFDYNGYGDIVSIVEVA